MTPALAVAGTIATLGLGAYALAVAIALQERRRGGGDIEAIAREVGLLPAPVPHSRCMDAWADGCPSAVCRRCAPQLLGGGGRR